MIESIEKLRESSHLDDSKWTLENGDVVIMCGRAPDDPNAVNWGEQWREIADEIEAEIAANYLELPVDADGVPIRVGDMVSLNGREPFEVGGVRDAGNQWHVFPYDLQRWYAPLDLHHVTSRTIEDVLVEFYGEFAKAKYGEDSEVLSHYADEIRELMEVD